MQPAGDHWTAREGDVQRIARGEFCLGELADTARQGFFQRVFGEVGLHSDLAALVGIKLRDRTEQSGYLATPTQVAHPPLLGAIRVGQRVQFVEGLAGQRLNRRRGW